MSSPESSQPFSGRSRDPLSIRSSSLLEDAHVQSTAGLYKTYMIPNNHDDFFIRLAHLMTAVKLVYASTFFERPLTFARSISKQFQEDSMAVIVQQLAGSGTRGFSSTRPSRGRPNPGTFILWET